MKGAGGFKRIVKRPRFELQTHLKAKQRPSHWQRSWLTRTNVFRDVLIAGRCIPAIECTKVKHNGKFNTAALDRHGNTRSRPPHRKVFHSSLHTPKPSNHGSKLVANLKWLSFPTRRKAWFRLSVVDFYVKTGAANRIRTCDPIITNDVLYRLSYCGTFSMWAGPTSCFARRGKRWGLIQRRRGLSNCS
jgi:hypothetical protein